MHFLALWHLLMLLRCRTAYTHYQHYQHYPQASYGHYQQYVPPQTQTQTQTQTTVPAPVQPVASTSRPTTQTTQSNAVDTADIATLNDALGSAGVDLRAEEESLQRSYDQYHSFRPYEDRSRKQPPKPAFDTRLLGTTMRTVGAAHKVTKIPEDAVAYLALALRARLEDLVSAMAAASAHRADTQFDRPAAPYPDGTPMWGLVVRADVAKQLAALERAEREEEVRVRRERRERAEAAAAAAANAAAAVPGGDEEEDGAPKKKKKKDGPGVTARNMSEDVRKKMSNAVASQAAGLGTGKYAWMNAAAAAPVPKPKPTPALTTTSATTTSPAPGSAGGSAGRWARPYVPTKQAPETAKKDMEDSRRAITLRDAMFVIENERGHGGGRGSAQGWT
ncbi:hypothetical protein OBBRIDRAFT_121415 [Obba rivulosa]|uniref:Transcription initiation factor TFIID subunit 4 n=1 Tax=Obba rivulosa TaxID=1052685 RepID=A0A8E2J4A4_9APHY|nr:hypothetical protein OBBRIDRAFT_121415 [Obba rivulosa]